MKRTSLCRGIPPRRFGDFYLKRKLGEESVQRGVQSTLGETLGFLEPGQPQALRAAVLRFASRNVYIRQALWRINFNWANEELSLIHISEPTRPY